MSRRTVASVLLLTFTVSACRTWTPIETLSPPGPDAVRVELASGERAQVMDARVEGDSLIGRLVGETGVVRIPLSQIVTAEAGRVSNGRTASLVVGLGLASLVFLGLMVEVAGGGFFNVGMVGSGMGLLPPS